MTRTVSNQPASYSDELRAAYARVAGRAYPRQEAQGGRGTADSLNNRALSYLDLGKVREAEETWGAALAANPNHSETLYNFGILRWRRGEMSDAELVRQLESVRARHELKWKDEYLLALVHLERGDVTSAASLLQSALQNAPESVEVLSALRAVRTETVDCHTAQLTLHAHTTPVAAFVRPDGREVLAVGADGLTESWEIKTGRRLRTFGNELPVAFAVSDRAGQDFELLLRRLQYAGYGWLSPEGVRRKLQEMASFETGTAKTRFRWGFLSNLVPSLRTFFCVLGTRVLPHRRTVKK